jgi:hypothetical protein
MNENHKYGPLRSLEEIRADMLVLENETEGMMKEILKKQFFYSRSQGLRLTFEIEDFHKTKSPKLRFILCSGLLCWLPREGSNLDSSDPESDVLPVTPQGNSNFQIGAQSLLDLWTR